MWWPFSKPEPKTFDTLLGTFERRSNKRTDPWELEYSQGDGRVLLVYANNVDGAPSPEFLQKLPRLLQNIAAIEALARSTTDRIGVQHELLSIAEEPDCDCVVRFAYKAVHTTESIYIRVTGNQAEVDFIID
jgi:hypothetical protein